MKDMGKKISILLRAINRQLDRNNRLLYNIEQFVGKEGDTMHMYKISRANYDEETGHNGRDDIYRTVSKLRMVLFLRDYLFLVTDKELPEDNERWNKVRATIFTRKEDGQWGLPDIIKVRKSKDIQEHSELGMP